MSASADKDTKRGVQWAEDMTVHDIPHLDDLDDEEVEAVWYCAQDYSDFKSGYQLTIFLMESGEFQEDDNHTSRGLEYRTQEGAWARYENKRDAYNAVLDEQDRQWKVDRDDFERIRAIYLEHSAKCAEAAVERAARDYEDAKAVHQGKDENPKKTSRPNSPSKDTTPSAPTRKKSVGESKSKKSNGEKAKSMTPEEKAKLDEKRKSLEKKKAKLAKLKAENEKYQQQNVVESRCESSSQTGATALTNTTGTTTTSSNSSTGSNGDKKKTKKVVVVRKKSSSEKDRVTSV